jgi:hypothetical protein
VEKTKSYDTNHILMIGVIFSAPSMGAISQVKVLHGENDKALEKEYLSIIDWVLGRKKLTK